MKTKSALILAALCSLFLSSCASTGGGSASAVKPYPRDTCVVSGNKLGSMGPVITQVHNGQQVKFCCEPCTKKFAANPTKFMAGL